MRVSSLYGVALKEAPSDADSAGHRFLLRAGYIRQLGSGLFSALPLGRRALRKIEQILREEMDAIGGQEIAMPVVHPAALSHAAVVARHARAEVSSYRQLPMLVYQLQTRLHDAPQARDGDGLIHARERVMKDSCSLDRDQHGLERQCAALGDAYQRIFARCGLPVAVVASFVRSGTGPAQVGLAQLANRVNPPCSSGETSRASRKYSQLPTIGCMHGSG